MLIKRLVTLSALVVLASCGGGGGGGGSGGTKPSASPTPTPTPTPMPTPTWKFTDISASTGLTHHWGVRNITNTANASHPEFFGGGVAVGDYDGDGLLDLFIDAGDKEPSKLFRNLGNNRWQNVAEQAGVKLTAHLGSGPIFADVDGDGWLDLFVGGLEGQQNYLFLNNTDGTFRDASAQAGLTLNARNTVSAAFGDYNRDGYLDMAMGHWGNPFSSETETLFQGTGTGSFVDVSRSTRIADYILSPGVSGLEGEADYSFTPTFADLNNDGWPDLTMTADFSTSKYFLSDTNGQFLDSSNHALTDEFGMGSALGDYDNDGDLDWFVTSIYEFNDYAVTNVGNRLYQNNNGVFSDNTFYTRVENGGWGWGACFADVNNDGYLDIFHTNGWHEAGGTDPVNNDYRKDANRLFIQSTNGRFSDKASELGVANLGQGRAVVCFDADNDGDIDLLMVSNDIRDDAFVFYRNDDAGMLGNYLSVTLNGAGANTQAAGARIYATANGITQMREILIGGNFTSQAPTKAHFGFGEAEVITELRIVWPDGDETILQDVNVNQHLTLSEE